METKRFNLRSKIINGGRECSNSCAFWESAFDSDTGCHCKESWNDWEKPTTNCPSHNADLVEIEVSYTIVRTVENLEIEGLNQIFNNDKYVDWSMMEDPKISKEKIDNGLRKDENNV